MSTQIIPTYPIFTKPDATVPVGVVGYLQIGTLGSPKGLLVSLTTTPQYKKVIQTVNGFQGII